ncbi:MAG: beta-propeller domain-containing protein, partial [Lachnospiraceae bacterium]|nr:beta-propeller domain-containing protein [Lachnospiraceae bacterium]
MNDKEIMDKIKETAEDVSVPEELQPDVIEAMLEAEAKKDHTEPLPTAVIDMGTRPKRRWKKAYTGVVAAAMAAIILIPTALQPWVEQREATSTSSVAVEPEPTITPEEDSEPTITASVGDFGDTLHHPKNYREIYDVTKEYGERYRIDDEYVEYDTVPSSGFRFPSFGGNMEEAPSEAATAESSNEDIQKSAGSEDYSKTNTIEEDVAEGDVTITDGKYIYHYTNDAIVEILGTKGGKLTEEATIDLEDVSGIGSISYIDDMFVQDEHLVVVLDGYRVAMETKDKKTNRISDEYGVMALVYDIADAKHPKLTGYTSYEGNYYSSRIVGDELYMFTMSYPDYRLYGDEHILYDEEEFLESGVLPRINGEAPELDCIYLPERYQADPSFVMSSVKLDKPDKVQDYQVIMGYTSD